MTIETLKSPNPRYRNSISVIKSKFLSVSSVKILLTILKVSNARRDVILAGGLYHRFPRRHPPPPPIKIFTGATPLVVSVSFHQNKRRLHVWGSPRVPGSLPPSPRESILVYVWVKVDVIVTFSRIDSFPVSKAMEAQLLAKASLLMRTSSDNLSSFVVAYFVTLYPVVLIVCTAIEICRSRNINI